MAREPRDQRNAMLKLLFEQGWLSQRNAIMVGLIIVFGLWSVAPLPVLLTWWFLLLGASVYRLVLIHRFRDVADEQDNLDNYARLYLLGVIASGLIWGSTPYLVYPDFPMPQMLIVIVVLIGVNAGGALTLPASRWNFLIFGFLSSAPLVVRLLEQGQEGYLIVAISVFILIPALHIAAMAHHEFMSNMVTLANRNAALANSLQEANIEMTVEMSRQQEYEKAVRERDNALQLLNDLISDVDSEFQSKMTNLLQFGCRLFRMEAGGVARIDSNHYEILAAASATGPVPEKVGLTFDTRETVCSHTIVSESPVHFASSEEAGALIHPEARRDVGSYIGMPLTIDGKAWGTLNFYSKRHRNEDFSPADIDFIRLMAGWVQNSIELRYTKNALQSAEREKMILFDAMPMHIAHIDPDGCYTYVNRRYVERFSRERESFEGEHVKDVIGERNYELIKPHLTAALRGEYSSLELRPFDQNGKEQGERVVVIQYIPNTGPENERNGCFALTMDVTPDEETRTMMAAIAERDMLTGLVARESFAQQLQQLLNDKRSSLQEHSLCLIDIDDFAVVNQRGGQLVGDEVLRRIADLVRVRKRSSDLFARSGGDEFLLLLPDCALAKARNIARELCRAVQAMKITSGNLTLEITVSIGLVSFPGTISNRDYLLQKVDEMLAEAKSSGKNRVNATHLEVDSAETG